MAADEGGISSTRSQTKITKVKDKIIQLFYNTLGLKKGMILRICSEVPEHTWKLWSDEGYRDIEILKHLGEFLAAENLDGVIMLFRKVFRNKYSYIFKSLENTCYTSNHFIDMIIEYALGDTKPIGKPGQLFLFPDHKLFTWEYEEHVDRYVYCADDYQERDLVGKLKRSLPTNQQNGKYFYHCTNWTSAINICNDGPLFYKGRSCLDFGIQPSFYVTPDLKYALEWRNKKKRYWNDEIAIIVFKDVNINIPESRNKIWNEIDNDWKELTAHSRRCKESSNELDKHHFIYGPMVANVEQVKKGFPSKPHKIPKFQLASKKNKTDEYLHECIYGIIIFSKDSSV